MLELPLPFDNNRARQKSVRSSTSIERPTPLPPPSVFLSLSHGDGQTGRISLLATETCLEWRGLGSSTRRTLVCTQRSWNNHSNEHSLN